MNKPLSNTPLLNALHEQVHLNRHRFHVPFHSGINLSEPILPSLENWFHYDLTELPPLDVLGDPQGVLLESQAMVAELFGARQSFYLINGASVGIMAALMALELPPGRQVLVARNCHRSVIHGLILTGAEPVWMLPEVNEAWGLWGGIDPMRLRQKLHENPQISAFVMTHPTYEGISSDIKAIQAICAEHNVLLIVDEAHGSLWPLVDDLPTSALEIGADAVIHSLHKSGGSLTQTGLLHLPLGSGLSPERVQQCLNLLQTTSPSYPLLANLEATCFFLGSEAGQTLIAEKLENIRLLRAWIASELSTIEAYPVDASRQEFQLFLRSSKYTGEMLAEILEERYALAFESALPRGVLLNLNLGLTKAAFDALQSALLDIDKASMALPDVDDVPIHFELPNVACLPQKAFFPPGEAVSREKSVGRIAKSIVATCPPGIPILMPGEIIHERHLPYLADEVQVVL